MASWRGRRGGHGVCGRTVAPVPGLSDEVVARTRTILSGIGLPVTCDKIKWADLRETMNVDKKTRVDPQTGRQVLRFVGIHKPGQVAMIVDPDEATLAECYDRCSAR